KRFVAQSLQLRNDICNEPTWMAVFTDQEVNAWLAEDLVTEFADQLPPEVHEPRVMFELDRVTLAFELDQGPVRSVIWVVARRRPARAGPDPRRRDPARGAVEPLEGDRPLAHVAHPQGPSVEVPQAEAPREGRPRRPDVDPAQLGLPDELSAAQVDPDEVGA